jgi:hypothetical protein
VPDAPVHHEAFSVSCADNRIVVVRRGLHVAIGHVREELAGGHGSRGHATSMEQNHTDSQLAKNCEELNLSASKLSDASSVKVRRNNITTRVVAAKPPPSVLAAGELSGASRSSRRNDRPWGRWCRCWTGHGAREASAPEVIGLLFSTTTTASARQL